MRIWFDMTAPAHPVVFRPVIARLRAAGREVEALAGRTARMIAHGRRRRFDLAVAHGSNDLALAAAALRIPEVNMFDYEFAVQQHNIGCRLASRVMTPDAIPPERLERYGVGPGKLVQY